MSTLVIFIVCIGLLIFVHELGHFVAARIKGIRVLKFSLGFGPKIIGKKVGETEYQISALPLGGYVKMAGEDVTEEETPGPDEFPSKSVLDRATVVLAGPIMNVIIAFLFMPLVFFIGIKMPAFLEEPPIVGLVEARSPAETGGIQTGDRIVEINRNPVSNWNDVATALALRPELGINIAVEREKEVKQLFLEKGAGAPYTGSGYAGILPNIPPVIGKVNKGYPAAQAGLKEGDRIVEIDGTPVGNWYQVSSYIRSHVEKEISVAIVRGDEKIIVTVSPIKDQTGGYGVIGIINRQETVIKKYGIIESIGHGMSRMYELTMLTFDVLKRLFSFNLSIETLGGPIMIAKLTGEAAQSGISDLIAFVAFMSLQLGILNLLPIPVLDGGWVIFLLIERIKGSPLSKKTMEVAQTVGFALLITLIVIVSYNDILRVFK